MSNHLNPGIHHVTAITEDAQSNIDFYYGILGLRLVKITVNFDDPGSYHLYYGDHHGAPGTIMTFFAWSGGNRGRIGPPQVTTTAFSIPLESVQYWVERLQTHNVPTQDIVTRFGETVIGLTDPDGMRLELIGTTQPHGTSWIESPVPLQNQIRGFHGVTISLEGCERTAQVLTEILGFHEDQHEGNRYRYVAHKYDTFASTVDLVCSPGAQGGTMGTGIVHHIAFRTPDDEAQLALRKTLIQQGFNPSPVMDRNYFHSIYFREPGGVLFEIATDAPGFTVDEPLDTLGTQLQLPAQYESNRTAIERLLPKLELPN